MDFYSYNKTRSLSSDELYYKIFYKELLTIIKTSISVLIGFLASTIVVDGLKMSFSDENKIYYLIILFIILLILAVIATQVFTIDRIQEDKNKILTR